MRRKPTRPDNEISQTYNSGLLTVCDVSNEASPGDFPAERLTKKVSLRYEERRLGLNRLYLARQSNVEIVRVVRTPYRPEVSPQDVAVLPDGRVYRIDAVQLAVGVYPPSMDLSLAKMEARYEVV